MGHYRSEVFDVQDEIDEKRRKKRKTNLIRGIRLDIEARGIEYVLADILTDPNTYKWKFD